MQCPQRVTAVFGWIKHKNEIIHSFIYQICAGWVLTLCYLGWSTVLIKGLCLPTGSFHSMGQQRLEQVSKWSLTSVLSVRCAGGHATQPICFHEGVLCGASESQLTSSRERKHGPEKHMAKTEARSQLCSSLPGWEWSRSLYFLFTVHRMGRLDMITYKGPSSSSP